MAISDWNGKYALVVAVLALAGVAAAVWWWTRRRKQAYDDMREGAVVWGCPAGKDWGWGAEGNGKCCDVGTNKNCVGAVQKSTDGKDYRCPPGKEWGWGKGAGKCCKAGTADQECVGATLEQVARNQSAKGKSDASLEEQGLVRDPVTGDVISPKELKKREKERRKAGGSKPSPKTKVKEGDVQGVCPPGKAWGWGAGAGKCCKPGTADQECVAADYRTVGKRCENMTKPTNCAPGFKPRCQKASNEFYEYRCCKKSKLTKGYVCDDDADAKRIAAGTISGTVPTRVDGDKCPPGTTKAGKDCTLLDQKTYLDWFNRFYVAKDGQGKCPVGTTGTYKFLDGTTDGAKCQVTDENKYLGWKKSLTPKPTTPAPTLDPNLAVTLFSDSDFGGSSQAYKVGEYPDLGGMSDSVSSLKVPKGLKVTLYQKTNYEGKSLTLDANDHPNLKHFAFDDWQPSMSMMFSTVVADEAYKEGQWYGKDVCGVNNTHCWNDTASSMKVYPA